MDERVLAAREAIDIPTVALLATTCPSERSRGKGREAGRGDEI